MQKRLSAKLMMYQSIQTILNSNKEVWQSVSIMADVINNFETLLGEIATYHQLTGENKKGITEQKAGWQKQLIDITYQVSSALFVMATRANDPVIAQQTDYTETDLVKTRDAQLVTCCSAIEELALKHQAALTAFGITGNDLAQMHDAIKRFSESLPTMRVTVSERKTANEKLKDLFAQTDALLKNQVDRLMVRFKQSQPTFYATYKTSRHVINYGVRHKKEKGEGEMG